MSEVQEFRQRLLELARSYRPSEVLITCAELGVLEAVDKETTTATELAVRLGVDGPALERLLNTAVAMEFLEKQGNKYSFTLVSASALSPRSSLYVGNMIRREQAFYRRWSNLAEAVKSGMRPEENKQDEVVETNWVRTFEYALYDQARQTAPAVTAVLGPLLPVGQESVGVIDVGGGHGGYSISLSGFASGITATVFELPAAAAVATEIIANAEASDRVNVQAGDFRVDSLGSDYDMALLFGVLVSETTEGAVALLRKVKAALKPGGLVAIRGFYLNPDRIGPLDANLFDLHMLLSNNTGGSHTIQEVESWLAQSGFEPPQSYPLPAPERTSLLVSRKPHFA